MIGSRRGILNSTSTNLVGDGVTLIDQSKIVWISCLILFLNLLIVADSFPYNYFVVRKRLLNFVVMMRNTHLS